MDAGKNLYIHTIGCQMNVYDAEQMGKYLYPLGYRITPFPDKADLIIINTCSVREKAEQKTYSYLGRLAGMKKKRPGLIIGVSGCVAQQEGGRMVQRVPEIDFVLGTRVISRLPQIVAHIEERRSPIVAIDDMLTIEENPPPVNCPEQRAVTAFVTIMRGCDNYCTYCVVPYVRGREVSRAPEAIIDEIRSLVASGIREVTLLGQNVNSYGQEQELCSFNELLFGINNIEGLWRIRFTTSHPKDLSDNLIDGFKSLVKLCHHIHLPVQSGSNRILKLMNRRYTREQYLEKIIKLRQACPDIGISSDLIVGFPGETRDDFNQTLDLINRVHYDSLFIFNYSDRPNVPAARFPGKITDPEKKERFEILLSLQREVTLRKHQALVGSVVQVLTEGRSKKQSETQEEKVLPIRQWTGRTSTNKIVNFSGENAGSQNLTGKLLNVKVTKAFRHSLQGELSE